MTCTGFFQGVYFLGGGKIKKEALSNFNLKGCWPPPPSASLCIKICNDWPYPWCSYITYLQWQYLVFYPLTVLYLRTHSFVFSSAATFYTIREMSVYLSLSYFCVKYLYFFVGKLLGFLMFFYFYFLTRLSQD